MVIPKPPIRNLLKPQNRNGGFCTRFCMGCWIPSRIYQKLFRKDRLWEMVMSLFMYYKHITPPEWVISNSTQGYVHYTFAVKAMVLQWSLFYKENDEYIIQ